MPTHFHRQSCVIMLLLVATNLPLRAESLRYEVTFDATWSADSHPLAYPTGAHFSPLIGATHNSQVSFWSPGELASAGIEQMAETGGRSLLQSEIDTAIAAESAAMVISGSGINSPGTTTVSVEIGAAHPLVTLVTMVAPSPDWFIGVQDLELRTESGIWPMELIAPLFAYDAGTDDGLDFGSPDADSSPAQPISALTDPLAPTQAPLGTFTFRLQTSSLDCNGDEVVDVQDANCWTTDLIETGLAVIGSRRGDADGDGTVQFGDFVVLANHFGQTGNYTEGDFDRDGLIDFSDFVILANNFGVTGSANAATVPEPTSGLLAVLVACAGIYRRRRSRGTVLKQSGAGASEARGRFWKPAPRNSIRDNS